MAIFEEVRHLVSEAARSGRLRPVAVRCHVANSQPTADHLADLLAMLAEAANFEATSLRVQRVSRGEHILAHVQCRQGESMLLSIAVSKSQRGPIELTIIGQRGIAAWEPDDVLAKDDTVTFPRVASDALRHAVQVALESDEPVNIDSPRAVTHPAVAAPASSSPSTSKSFAPLKPPLGVLLVTGSHSHQENYARSFADDPRCRLIGLTDEPGLPAERVALNARLAKELGIPMFDDFDAAIRRPDVQIISNCAAPERRANLIYRAARAGKHLYLDKPLTVGIEESDLIAKEIAETGVLNQMFSLVHTRFAERVRQVVQSGELGELVAVHCDAFFAKGMAGTADLTKPRRELRRPTAFERIEAKRELHNVGVYSLVLLRWLLRRDVRRVYANTCNYFFAEHQKLDMEDYAHVSLELDGGVVATVATGRTGWKSHPMGGMNRVLLVGTKRTINVDWYRPRLDVWSDEEPWQLPRRHPQDPMGFWSSTVAESGAKAKTAWLTPAETTTDVRHFIDCIVAGRGSDVTAADGAAVMEMLLAAYESAASGASVALPLRR